MKKYITPMKRLTEEIHKIDNLTGKIFKKNILKHTEPKPEWYNSETQKKFNDSAEEHAFVYEIIEDSKSNLSAEKFAFIFNGIQEDTNLTTVTCLIKSKDGFTTTQMLRFDNFKNAVKEWGKQLEFLKNINQLNEENIIASFKDTFEIDKKNNHIENEINQHIEEFDTETKSNVELLDKLYEELSVAKKQTKDTEEKLDIFSRETKRNPKIIELTKKINELKKELSLLQNETFNTIWDSKEQENYNQARDYEQSLKNKIHSIMMNFQYVKSQISKKLPKSIGKKFERRIEEKIKKIEK